jgi:hypothetical protein
MTTQAYLEIGNIVVWVEREQLKVFVTSSEADPGVAGNWYPEIGAIHASWRELDDTRRLLRMQEIACELPMDGYDFGDVLHEFGKVRQFREIDKEWDKTMAKIAHEEAVERERKARRAAKPLPRREAPDICDGWARLMTSICFSAGFDGRQHLDVDGAAAALRQAGYEVHRMPDKYRWTLRHPRNDFLEATIASPADEEGMGKVLDEVNHIVERFGGDAAEVGEVEPGYVPFAEGTKDLEVQLARLVCGTPR